MSFEPQDPSFLFLEDFPLILFDFHLVPNHASYYSRTSFITSLMMLCWAIFFSMSLSTWKMFPNSSLSQILSFIFSIFSFYWCWYLSVPLKVSSHSTSALCPFFFPCLFQLEKCFQILPYSIFWASFLGSLVSIEVDTLVFPWKFLLIPPVLYVFHEVRVINPKLLKEKRA